MAAKTLYKVFVIVSRSPQFTLEPRLRAGDFSTSTAVAAAAAAAAAAVTVTVTVAAAIEHIRRHDGDGDDDDDDGNSLMVDLIIHQSVTFSSTSFIHSPHVSFSSS